MAQTLKTSVDPIGALASLDKPTDDKTPNADPAIVAAATSPDSAAILANMQKRVAELTSPYRSFQSGLDEMVARSQFHPQQALASVQAQKEKEANELQNIGTTMAQVDIMRNQLKGMRDTFSNLTSPISAVGKDILQAKPGENLSINVNGNRLELSPYDVENLKHFVDTNDIKGFNAAFKSIADIQARALADARAKLNIGPEGLETVETSRTVVLPNGQKDTIPMALTKREIEDWDYKGKFPQRLLDAGYKPLEEYKPPIKVQKKAAGGIMNPINDSSTVNPMGDVTTSVPAQPYNPKILENVIGAVTGSGNAFAGDPRTMLSPKALQSQQEYSQQSSLSSQQNQQAIQQAKNQAQLESEKKEREEAGMFVGKIGSLASTFDEIQRRSNAIINHASKHPEEFAYKQQTGPYSYLLEGAGAIPVIGEKLEPALEGIKAKASGQDTINRRSETQGHADSLGIEYTQEKFAGTGARIGQGLTQIAQNAKNIGVDKPAKTNLVNAYMIQATAGKYKDWAQAWQDYKKENPKNPDPFAFQQSPAYKAVEDKWGLYLDQKLSALEKGVPENGTKDVDKNGNPIIWKDGKAMRAKQ